MKSLTQNVWLILAALIAIFLCGSGSGYVFGSLGGKASSDRALAPRTPSEWSGEALNALAANLSLTPDQVETLSPILEKAGQSVTKERERALFQIHLNILKVHDDIRPTLEPEQQKELDLSRKKMVTLIESRFSSLIDGDGVPPNTLSPETP